MLEVLEEELLVSITDGKADRNGGSGSACGTNDAVWVAFAHLWVLLVVDDIVTKDWGCTFWLLPNCGSVEVAAEALVALPLM